MNMNPNKQYKPMLQLFRDWHPNGLAPIAGECWLTDVVLQKNARSLTAELYTELLITKDTRNQLEQSLARHYDLLTVELRCEVGTDSRDALARAEEAREAELRRLLTEERKTASSTNAKKTEKKSSFMFGTGDTSQLATSIGELTLKTRGVVVLEGLAFSGVYRTTRRGGFLVGFTLGNETGAIRVIKFISPTEEHGELAKLAQKLENEEKSAFVRVAGRVQANQKDMSIELDLLWMTSYEKPIRDDQAEEKRVELHLHSNMSERDALTPVGDYVARAARWGHKAVAVTDHAVVHSYPDAYDAGKKSGVKILYGLEAYFINDMDDRLVVNGSSEEPLDGTLVVFDVETTGFHAKYSDRLTEIGAVKLKNGEIVDTFNTFVDPEQRLRREITNITGIKEADLKGAPKEAEAVAAFLAFAGNAPLVGHNVLFDMSFLYEAAKRNGIAVENAAVDTLPLAQNLLPKLSKYTLDSIATYLHLPSFQHHRASDDAKATALMYLRLVDMAREHGITNLGQMNELIEPLRVANRDHVRRQPRHLIIFAQTQVGIRNLYKLISLANLKYYKRYPLIPKSVLEANREGLVFGSACEAGELFRAVLDGRPEQELLRVASWYDYLEIQPISNNRFLIRDEHYDQIKTDEDLMNLNRTILALGDKLGKPVCATCDAHYLDPEQEIYRRILLAGKNFSDVDEPCPLFFRTTDEMLKEFSYLGEARARDVVITNTNKIADMIDEVRPLPEGLYPPSLENSRQELEQLVWDKTHALYGENPPELVQTRVETELNDIITSNYDVIYMSAQKLVKNSLDAGYLVGSRGSVGSSIVAFMSGITEVNALPAHYRCPSCKHTDFEAGKGYGCGVDLPDICCPECGTSYVKDGFDIPFEVFLGFGGDKIPDIDLNFSGEYQAKAHEYCFEIFGKSHVFRAGTISALKLKTARSYTKKYAEERNIDWSRAEEDYMSFNLTGVKRTTGQHPGGMVVIPQDKEIYDFCPVQNPPGKGSEHIITTHFDYHKMESNLLKLDLLGHDDPTIVRMLYDLTGINPQDVPLDDEDTMSIFRSRDVLKFAEDKRFAKSDEEILGIMGSCAIPEFGTKFVRGMLQDTMPEDFDTLLSISGFSHGTDVWLGNAQDLIKENICAVREAIGCRDDIMRYLIRKGMEEKKAFKIMEKVRKGKSIDAGEEEAMLALGVPEWYTNSCKKIKYLFPRAHAVAYVMMAFRIAWFKVHQPMAFYAAYFSVRAKAFDATVMCNGIDQVVKKLREIDKKGRDATDVEQNMVTTLEVCYEFYRRGFYFTDMSLYESDAINFQITQDGKSLVPPFLAVPQLGETVAQAIVEARGKGSYIAVDEFARACPKISKTNIDDMKSMGVFGDMPDELQIALF